MVWVRIVRHLVSEHVRRVMGRHVNIGIFYWRLGFSERIVPVRLRADIVKRVRVGPRCVPLVIWNIVVLKVLVARLRGRVLYLMTVKISGSYLVKGWQTYPIRHACISPH